jgi:hypothetical protein
MLSVQPLTASSPKLMMWARSSLHASPKRSACGWTYIQQRYRTGGLDATSYRTGPRARVRDNNAECPHRTSACVPLTHSEGPRPPS